MKQNLSKTLFLLFVGLFLFGCGQPQKEGLQPYQPEQAHYKYPLKISTNHPLLTQALKNEFVEEKRIYLTEESHPSVYHLIVNYEQKSQSPLPRLVGHLKKTTEDHIFHVQYTLTNASGKVYSKNQLSIQAHPTEKIAPSLLETNYFPPEIVPEIAQKIAPEMIAHIYTEPWRTKVIAVHEDGQHVTVDAGKELGLAYNHILVTESLPKATLRIMTFDTTPSGTSRATLKLVEGQLPSVGKNLTIPR